EEDGVDDRHEHRPAEAHHRLLVAQREIAPRHLVQQFAIVVLLPQHLADVVGKPLARRAFHPLHTGHRLLRLSRTKGWQDKREERICLQIGKYAPSSGETVSANSCAICEARGCPSFTLSPMDVITRIIDPSVRFSRSASRTRYVLPQYSLATTRP